MTKKQKIKYFIIGLLLFIITAILVVVTVVVLFNKSMEAKKTVNQSKITATVTRLDRRANIAENGYIFIFAEGKTGQRYRVDASAFMNYAPMDKYINDEDPYSGYNFDCLDLPAIKEGDVIQFYLPGGDFIDNNQSRDNTMGYSICFDKDSESRNDYYIRNVQ